MQQRAVCSWHGNGTHSAGCTTRLEVRWLVDGKTFPKPSRGSQRRTVYLKFRPDQHVQPGYGDLGAYPAFLSSSKWTPLQHRANMRKVYTLRRPAASRVSSIWGQDPSVNGMASGTCIGSPLHTVLLCPAVSSFYYCKGVVS